MTEPKQSNTWSWEERRAIVREFQASGQSQRAFCRQWGITPTTLRSWCRRLGNDEDRAHDAGDEARASTAHAPVRLLPVHLGSDQHAADKGAEEAGIQLVTRSGLRIAVNAGFDAPTLQRLLATLRATP